MVIAGTGSGVGKTSIATGIMKRLSKNMKVQGFKVGPDFIDPMYHTSATGRPSRNLDSFMMSKDVVRNVASYGSRDADICVVEGVRGLYEGSSGKDDSGSTAEIAKLLGFPVVLIVNARSLTRSAAAMINGFRMYDDEINIAGVILNNVSGRQHEDKLKDAMESSRIPILGMIRRNVEHKTPERHLGLRSDMSENLETINSMEELVGDIDIGALVDISYGPEQEIGESPYFMRDSGLKAAIPMDDAFCFYYRENIECMEASGIKIEYFSPLKGDMLPDADIYYLGGGYPELYIDQISENKDFLQGLNTACQDNKVIIGECGGMLTLCSSIKVNGNRYETAGIFDAEADMVGKRHGPSYVIARPNDSCRLFSEVVKGHEFHYTSVDPGTKCEFGLDILRGNGLVGKRDGMVKNNAIGSYMHQHALSTEDWLKKIVDICE